MLARERRPRRLTKDKRPNVKRKMVLSIRWLAKNLTVIGNKGDERH